MPITVGLCKEILYLAKIFQHRVTVALDGVSDKPIQIDIDPNATIYIRYKDNLIWTEKMDGEESFFGVESVDSISRCIICIDNNSDWKNYSYFQK